jgi:hypothetical protein
VTKVTTIKETREFITGYSLTLSENEFNNLSELLGWGVHSSTLLNKGLRALREDMHELSKHSWEELPDKPEDLEWDRYPSIAKHDPEWPHK